MTTVYLPPSSLRFCHHEWDGFLVDRSEAQHFEGKVFRITGNMKTVAVIIPYSFIPGCESSAFSGRILFGCDCENFVYLEPLCNDRVNDEALGRSLLYSTIRTFSQLHYITTTNRKLLIVSVLRA
ncbi:hypothetical protein AMECASPLE_033867 [Ameca splendens]|uniref:Uncharacterized protein n=1 Tax=Ameca splendens TaxID=208324 RepID=A0ABV1A2C5_9TELE